ncbi:MAG: glycosyltransferase family 2 protein [Candidatus Bathyarchaeia archaeon]
MSISVIVPMRNEGENVRPLADEIYEFIRSNNLMTLTEVIFVDDNSEDDTYGQIKLSSAKFPLIKAIRLNGEGGKGAAIKAGIKEARGDILVTMDGDLQHSPQWIPSLVMRIMEDGLDLVVAARMYGSCSPYRRVLSRAFSWIFNALFGLRLTTPNEGFKAFRRVSVSQLNISANDFDFDIELLVKAKRAGLKIGEVPILLRTRLHGTSKVRTLKVVPLFLYRMVKLWLDLRRRSALR